MITNAALKRLAQLKFRITTPPDSGEALERLPFIVADESSYPARLTWRIPSVGDVAMDMNLGELMALGYQRLELDTDGEDAAALNLAHIAQAMEHGGAGEYQRAMFFATLERFNVCALCRPGQLPALRDRLKRLTDADLNALYLAALRGETLPDFFADTNPDAP
jgi:hypothetical protein